MQIPSLDDVLLTAAQLKRRWGGCSDMLLWRRLARDGEMPAPLRMSGRRYWYLSAILAYECRLAERNEKGPSMRHPLLGKPGAQGRAAKPTEAA
jgi:hypothetical protein